MNKPDTQSIVSKKPNFLATFMGGVKNASSILVNNMLPGIVFAFILTAILESSGLLTIIGKVFAPLMAVFGLPGEAMACYITSIFTLIGGSGAAAALVTSGTMNAEQATILLPMMYCVGSMVGYVMRLLPTSEVPARLYKIVIAIAVVCSIIIGFIMRIII